MVSVPKIKRQGDEKININAIFSKFEWDPDRIEKTQLTYIIMLFSRLAIRPALLLPEVSGRGRIVQ
jgi:hypothetical protein